MELDAELAATAGHAKSHLEIDELTLELLTLPKGTLRTVEPHRIDLVAWRERRGVCGGGRGCVKGLFMNGFR